MTLVKAGRPVFLRALMFNIFIVLILEIALKYDNPRRNFVACHDLVTCEKN